MNPASDHLTDAQIRDCVKHETTDPVAAKRFEAHLTDCEACLNRVLEAERIDLGLLEGDGMKRTPYPGCPAEETIQELAAGICASDIAEATTEHAAHCDHCGPLLARYLKEFSDDLPTEDEKILGRLKTASPRWQEKFIHKNVPRPKTSWFGFWPKLVTAAGAVAAAVGGYIFLAPNDLRQAQQLVAAAYQERRTTEMRFPSAPHAAIQSVVVKRGTDTSDLASDPPALLNAQGLVNEKHKAGELNAQWLEVQGRISLLQAELPGSTRKATAAFEQALREDSGNINLKIDLATAYFEDAVRAEPEHPVLAKTLDLLNQILKDPAANQQQRSAALFNLAIAYQKSNMRDLAVSTWEQYLQIDPSGPWADEARSRLQETKEKTPDPKLQGYVNSRDPSFFLANSSNPVVQHNLEEYQETALTSWLLHTPSTSQAESWRAAAKLANLLEERHADLWLNDFLSPTRAAQSATVQTLGGAIAANRQGLYEQALSELSPAAKSLAAENNRAGELRARFEEVYALRSLMRGQDCLARSAPLEKRLSGSRYLWLQSQLLLEQAQCENFLEDWAGMKRDLTTSLALANKAGFRVLELRIKGITAGIENQQERYTEAWTNNEDGMGEYWSEAYPAVRLSQFYDVLWQCALALHYSYAAEALLRHTLELRKSPEIKKNPVREGMIHIYLAGILSQRGDVRGAENERKEGLDLLSQVSEEYPQLYKVVANIEPAENELEQQNAQRALATLQPAERMLQATQDSFFSLRFYRLLGRCYLRLKRLDEATAAYRSAIHMAEASLKGLSTAKDRADWMQATSDSYRGLVRVLLDQKKTEEALALWEWYRSRFLVHSLPASSFDPASWGRDQAASLRQSLPRVSEPRIIYAGFDDGLQIWVYQEGHVSSRWVDIKQAELRHAVEEFARQCSTPNSDLHALQQHGESLYAKLFQPIISEVPEKGILRIELDDAISDLSFAALRDDAGHYIAERYAIEYSPGIWMETKLRSPGAISVRDPLLLVDASRSDDGPLPGASLERRAVSELFEHPKIVDSGKTKWEAWRQDLPSAEVFVFLGHGKHDGSGTALVLNPQESIAAKDIAPELLPRAKLVILSACSTGVGQGDGILDVENLVHSFLSAGVPNVIASQWDIDSATTAKLMDNFYPYLEKEKKPVLAIADAQRTMLRDMPHPYYWAGFTLTGKPN